VFPLRTVLCASDLSDAASEAIDQAAAISRRDGARLVVLHVMPVPVVVPVAIGEVLVPQPIEPEDLLARDQAALYRQVQTVPAAASAVREVVRASGSVIDAILQRAESLAAELLVVASHRRSGVERVLLGSTALALVHKAHRPVLVARPPSGRGTVVAGTDLSLGSLAALRAAAEEARRRRARLIVVHALDLPPPSLSLGSASVPAPADDPRSVPAQRRAAEERLARFLGKAEVQAEAMVAEGPAAASIVALAEQTGVELIVVGTVSRRRLERVFLGSVADAVVRKAPCSVLTVPAPTVVPDPRGDLLDE
jgi:nucleotide-binding universal stress UspA family protein